MSLTVALASAATASREKESWVMRTTFNRRLMLAGLVLASGLATSTTAYAQSAPRIAVLTFNNRTSWWGRELGVSAASQLTVKLVKSNAFTVLERQEIDRISDELYRGQSGDIRPDQVAELGRKLGAEYLLTGECIS